MTVHRAALIPCVGHLVHARHEVVVRLCDEIDLVAWLARKVSNDVPILAWEILVQEEIVHSPRAVKRASRSSSSCGGCTRASATSSSDSSRRRSTTSPNVSCSKHFWSTPGVKPQRC